MIQIPGVVHTLLPGFLISLKLHVILMAWILKSTSHYVHPPKEREVGLAEILTSGR